jgi:N-ethylmaleimide reductase
MEKQTHRSFLPSFLPFFLVSCTPTENPFDVKCSTPNDIMAEYYAQRASGGLLITEGTCISEAGIGWRNAPEIRTAEHVEGWKNVVDKVHEKDGLIFLQLWHMGRQAHSSFHPSTYQIFAASDIPMHGVQVKSVSGENVDAETPTAMSLDQIQETIQDYVKAATLAKEAGFDGVEIHSANGYLIDNFLQSKSNQRTDQYGGSFDNRVRLLKEVFEAIVESGSYPANRVGFRLSPNGNFGDMGSEDNHEAFIHYAKVMNKYNPAYLHVMDGLGFGYHNKCKAVTLSDIRKVFDGTIMSNCGLTKDTAEGIIRSGAADLCAFGRLYMSNPDLPERVANDWPLEPECAYEHWWGYTAEKGYTDFSTYTPEKAIVIEETEKAQVAQTQ